MTTNLNLTIKEKEERKFHQTDDNQVVVRTFDSTGFNISNYDYIDYSNASSIKFYSGGSGGTLVATINITSSTVEKV
ncbi:MAG TPA: hypothetical protein V6C58_19695 [Allocoleopsis sp.]